MVAPIRTPRARGVKCDLCKNILSSATWLDQSKLATKPEEAHSVLKLVSDHDKTACPCIPKNIENLLVGSTHFEIHRLLHKDLEYKVHKDQCDIYQDLRQQHAAKSKTRTVINDCYDTKRGSRFKICPNYDRIDLQHLKHAIDYWSTAMQDQVNPFKPKLALSLGLTHHIVYACYLFKYQKILDYQLKTANLLLNVFRSIEGVTANANLHAYFLLIRTLMDVGNYNLARQYMKQASKLPNYQDKNNYESILLNCVDCELDLLDPTKLDKFTPLDDLSSLVKIQQNDRLQHYYARTLAMNTILRYIQFYKKRSENCSEFFHTSRYVCAIIQRCYRSSFELVISEKESSRCKEGSAKNELSISQDQISGHEWIRFAACDLSFQSMETLVEFYSRAGMPECLELLFNGLALVAFRNGCAFWQSRMISLAIDFDLLCERFDQVQERLDYMRKIVNNTSENIVMNLLRVGSEISSLKIAHSRKESVMKKDVILYLIERLRMCYKAQLAMVNLIELYDCKTNSHTKLSMSNDSTGKCKLVVADNSTIVKLKLSLLKFGISCILEKNIASNDARSLFKEIIQDVNEQNSSVLEFYTCQSLFEITLHFLGIHTSEQQLLEAVKANRNCFCQADDHNDFLNQQLANLNLHDQGDQMTGNSKRGKKLKTANGTRSCRATKNTRSRSKGTYEVAKTSQENLPSIAPSSTSDVMEIFENFASLPKEDVLCSYLRCSEPNPDYLMYRKVHELLLCLRLADTSSDDNLDKIVFHFTESTTANTMRYRWMMLEEQQESPFDQTTSRKQKVCPSHEAGKIRYLSFCNVLSQSEKLVKAALRSLPFDYRLVQFKYIKDSRADVEHLLGMCLDNSNGVFCFHTRRSLISDDFFLDANSNEEQDKLTIPNRLADKIEKSRNLLINSTTMHRTGSKRDIDNDIRGILYDFETELLGQFRFVVCAGACDYGYNELVANIMSDIGETLGRQPVSKLGAKMLFSGAPLLTRDEFCSTISSLYHCDSIESRVCHSKWLKDIEAFKAKMGVVGSVTTLLEKIPRGQIGLILNQPLENVPLESLPAVRILHQGIFRMPSLRLFGKLVNRGCPTYKINPDKVAYILDPANNLPKTRERFQMKLRANGRWTGVVGEAPTSEKLETWLSNQQLYVFIGHGAGTTYYNGLCKGKGLSAMSHIESAAIVLGCSSGRMQSEGPKLESFGIGWVFLLRGSPCYLGLLWDVTDTDIDRYTDLLMKEWITPKWPKISGDSSTDSASLHRYNGEILSEESELLTDRSVLAKRVCDFKYLVGSTPVIYGLPISAKD